MMHYLIRIEEYLGAAESSTAAKGAAQRAVIRNVTKALEGQTAQRLIVADNYYTSCALILLQKGFYDVGTHRDERLRWPAHFPFTQKKPKSMPRGTYRIAQANA
ncbi:hypothetical protein PI125_g4362 [Phytophthora idaei]|nr:hypothetical protein PI125_g4362 [Phytophthora idaei]